MTDRGGAMSTTSTTNQTDVLRDGFSGHVLRPAQPGYEEARRVFDEMIDRRPAVIARCASTADVAARRLHHWRWLRPDVVEVWPGLRQSHLRRGRPSRRPRGA